MNSDRGDTIKAFTCLIRQFGEDIKSAKTEEERGKFITLQQKVKERLETYTGVD